MRIHVDGDVYNWQPNGGISRIFTESLSRIGSYLPELRILLTTSKLGSTRAPQASWIQPCTTSDVRRPDLRFRVKRRLWRAQAFHSTYFNIAPETRLPSVATVYDYVWEEFTAIAGLRSNLVWRKKVCLEAANLIIAISDDTAERTFQRFRGSEKKVRRIYPGLGDEFRTAGAALCCEELGSRLRSLHPYLLFVGERSYYKNFGTLLRAFAGLPLEMEANLVVVGGSASLEPHEVQFIISRGLTHKIHLLGPISDAALRFAYRTCTAFVFPSCAEGFGIPLLEAMACLAPVLAADIPVFREVARDHARFFDPGSADELCELLREIQCRPPTADALDRARTHAMTFTWDKAAQALADVYRELI